MAESKPLYYHKQITISSSSGPLWQEVTNSNGSGSIIGGLAFPGNSASPIYDADGNLTFDGIWNYQWDAQNRLISMNMTNIGNLTSAPASNRLRLDFAYDNQNRRISKIIST